MNLDIVGRIRRRREADGQCIAWQKRRIFSFDIDEYDASRLVHH
ncbi:MAG: hypothetical protein ACLUI7_02240 [Coprococcus sp.]